MRIIENDFGGFIVKKLVVNARVINGLSIDSEPRYLDNDNETPYHWVTVELLDANGIATQQGAAIVWDKRLQENPSKYTDGKVFPVEIALSGEGAGVAQEHLTNGRFDIEALGLSLNLINEQVVKEKAVI